MNLSLIHPDWPAPRRVLAATTTRGGGISVAPFDALNLGAHVGDDPAAVRHNRARLGEVLGLRHEPAWLQQVHGTTVARLPRSDPAAAADASFTTEPGRVCVVLTADCLPVLFCDEAGTMVAAAHAGWRGLASGVLEAAIAALPCPPQRLLAWLGPAIGPAAFAVGAEVRAAFVADSADAARAFHPGAASGKWLCDLYALARMRLQRAGLSRVSGGGFCTFSEGARFYSFRRDGACGRLATLIWLQA